MDTELVYQKKIQASQDDKKEEIRDFNDRSLMQVFYVDGKREGECKVWNANGQLEKQSFYRNGLLDGNLKNGKLIMTINWKGNVKCGMKMGSSRYNHFG